MLERTEHEFSSTQVNLPLSIASKMIRWGRELIPDKALYVKDGDFGREEEVHVTVLFGLHANKADQVKEILEGEPPIHLTIGKTSIFESQEYDVVKFSVESEDLKRLNQKLRACEHTNTHPSYIPHCTIAYVKKGLGKKYVGKDKFDGTEIVLHEVLFSNKSRIKTHIPLGVDVVE